jgi:hypothetical protein
VLFRSASDVAKRMGAGDEEMLTVAGLAGGMGLSGNACGALGAAMWLNTLGWYRKHPGETPASPNKADLSRLLKSFNDSTGSEMLCQKITGRRFETVDEHTEFIKNGGCDKLINALAMAGM